MPGMRGSIAVAVLALLLLPVTAFAHVERTSYWPDPRPDTSVSPPAGGAPPHVRSLASALPPRASARARALRRVPAFTGAYRPGRAYRARDGQGRVRVVCQPSSFTVAKREIARARRTGFHNRPTEPLRRLTKKQAKRWLGYNRRFFRACGYH